MPSSKKKNSKSASRLSQTNANSSASPSPSVPSSPYSPPDLNVVSELEDDLRSYLAEASRKFPNFISTEAFAGRVSEDAPSDKELYSSRGCKIWLSEASMVASSIATGSIVSVSLASSMGLLGSFPLSDLPNECSRHLGFELMEKLADEAGNYFVLATVFPSCKVSKHAVRLSPNLSWSMGCPVSGRIIFVHPVIDQPLRSILNGNDNLPNNRANHISLCSTKELYLSPLSLKGTFMAKRTLSSQGESSAATLNGRGENRKISPPTTPLPSHARLSSPGPYDSSNASSYQESVSNSSDSYGASSNMTFIKEVLEDETSRTLVQTCIGLSLYSRNLLWGNLVTVPVLSRLWTFLITGARKLSTHENHCSKDQSDQKPFPHSADLEDHNSISFLINQETSVHVHLPRDIEDVPPKRRVVLTKHGRGDGEFNIGFDDSKLGGLTKKITELNDIIISSAVKGTLASMGLRPAKGVLLHGPPGTGKTCLAQFCAHSTGVNFFSVKGPEIISQYHGESERALHEIFNSAGQASPAVIFIDEVDAIAPTRADGSDELSQRMVATLLNLMDGISRTDGVLAIAATNRPDSIEPALRRPGRFDREIEIGVPSPRQRYEILMVLLGEMEHSLLDKDIQRLATATHGFVGADLAALCNEAALICLRRHVNLKMSYGNSNIKTSIHQHNGFSCRHINVPLCLEKSKVQTINGAIMEGSSLITEPCISQDIQNLTVTVDDFESARFKVRPSAMREVIIEVPKVKWEDVGGQREVKMQLMEAVEWPQKHQEAFKRIGTRPPTGVMLFGPPGCSKTLLARAVASEAGLNFLAVKGPELFSKWVGESEKAVRALFAKARANAPSIIFFDEIDGLAVVRGKETDGVSVADRVMSQLLVEMDGLHQRVNVTVIAATNRPDKIDPALLRPGRFDRLLYVGPPDENDREDIFNIHLRKTPCGSDVCVKELALLTKGCTGADISLICREAAMAAIEENLGASELTMEHLKTGIRSVQPSEVLSYTELSTKFQRLVLSSTH
ncbi:unnamed protein product [Cuscuta campestris]|uniref:AAA+ ATPase domain-containing protein n=1 Tax=Cuscuta campestris TaxID=132261 RepID=A0A484KU74_9ASTE|nr:unnamed protein product [Cuscuta campestris]